MIMATLTIQESLSFKSIQSPLAHYSYDHQFPHMQYILQFRLSELHLVFIHVRDGHFYTGDIRKRLDDLTNGCFTAIYGKKRIVAYTYVSTDERYVDFVLEVQKENHEVDSYIESFNLSANDIEYLYERMIAYENEHDLADRIPQYTIREILIAALDTGDFIPQDVPYEAYMTVLHLLLNDMADYILAQRGLDDGTMLTMDIMTEAFWHCLVQRMKNGSSHDETYYRAL